MRNEERAVHEGRWIGARDDTLFRGRPVAGNGERNDALGGVTDPLRRRRSSSSWLPVLMATLLMRRDQTERRPGHIKAEETGLLPAGRGLNYFIKWSAYKAAGRQHHAASQSFQAARPHQGSRGGSGRDALGTDGKHMG